MDIEKLRGLGHFDEKHRRQAIFSMDYCKAHDKLAVAGLDSSISFWNNILEEPKKTASITRHDGAVLCVRWAPSIVHAKLQSLPVLASGADDAVVLIWQQDNNPTASIGNLEGEGSTENYRVIKRLSGFHSADITGIEWSQDGRFLASCSIDGSVCIYDVNRNYNLLTRLEDHRASVKGLSWNPASSFLLTQGADRQTLLYKYSNETWTLELNVEEPLANSTFLDSMFARNSWSYDGNYFAVASASNGLLPAAVICEINDHSNQISLIGHLCAVDIVRFCPSSVELGGQNVYLVATASQDGWVSIWNSSFERPIAVVSELFDQAIMDVIWIPFMNGEVGILVCSYDGHVARIRLHPSTFGVVSTTYERIHLNQVKDPVTQDKLMAVVFESRNRTETASINANLAVERRIDTGKKRITPTLVSGGTPISSPASTSSVATTIEIKLSGGSSKRIFNQISIGPLALSINVASKKFTAELQNVRDGHYLLLVANASKERLWEEKIASHIRPRSLRVSGFNLFLIFDTGKVFTFSFCSGRKILPTFILPSSISGVGTTDDHAFFIDINGNYCLWELQSKSLLLKDSLTEGSDFEDILDISFISKEMIKIFTRNSDILVGLKELGMCSLSRPEVDVLLGKLEDIKNLPLSCNAADVENVIAYAISVRSFSFLSSILRHYVNYLCIPNYLTRLEEIYTEVCSCSVEATDQNLEACKDILLNALSRKSFSYNNYVLEALE